MWSVNMIILFRMRGTLDTPAREAWLRMIYDGRYKYILAEGYRPMLFDLQEDAEEYHDLGADPAHAQICARLHEALFKWARQRASATPYPMRPLNQQPFRNALLNPVF